MKAVLFNLTFACVIVIASNLLVVELNESINVEMMVAFVNLIVITVMTFAHFYLAEKITSDLLSIGDLFYNSAWYRLPIKQQKLLVLPIQRAQRELRLKCLGLFNCSMPVFSSVQLISQLIVKLQELCDFFYHLQIIRTAGSYYVIIRRFKWGWRMFFSIFDLQHGIWNSNNWKDFVLFFLLLCINNKIIKQEFKYLFSFGEKHTEKMLCRAREGTPFYSE